MATEPTPCLYDADCNNALLWCKEHSECSDCSGLATHCDKHSEPPKCVDCDTVATHCDDHSSTNECQSCEDEATHCDIHGHDNCHDECASLECDDCYNQATSRFCDEHIPQRHKMECWNCGDESIDPSSVLCFDHNTDNLEDAIQKRIDEAVAAALKAHGIVTGVKNDDGKISVDGTQFIFK